MSSSPQNSPSPFAKTSSKIPPTPISSPSLSNPPLSGFPLPLGWGGAGPCHSLLIFFNPKTRPGLSKNPKKKSNPKFFSSLSVTNLSLPCFPFLFCGGGEGPSNLTFFFVCTHGRAPLFGCSGDTSTPPPFPPSSSEPYRAAACRESRTQGR